MFPSLLPTYNRADIAFVRGEGPYLFAEDGQRYLDFGAGIAVNAFGHANPKLVAALTEQAGKLWHTSNLYRVPGQESLAKKLVDNTFADTVFFTNSGAEAMRMRLQDGAPLSLRERPSRALPHHHLQGRLPRPHAGGASPPAARRNISKASAPRVAGLRPGAGRRPEGGRSGDRPETAALMIEPIQGEGGMRVRCRRNSCARLRKLCDEQGLLLIFDEIQTGVGRTGKFFAYEWLGITPDIMAIAKGIGGGFPDGRVSGDGRSGQGHDGGHARHDLWRQSARPWRWAMRRSTWSLAPGFLDHVSKVANYLRQQLGALIAEHPGVFEEVRGQGLMLGLKMRVPNTRFHRRGARATGLIVLPAGDNVVRLLPPLIIAEDQAREGVELLDMTAAADFESGQKAVAAMNAPA